MSQETKPPERQDFASQAEEQQAGLFREFAEFLMYNKKWWLTPIILLLLLLGGLFVLGPMVPFIYALF